MNTRSRIDNDLRLRVLRLTSGNHKVEDLIRIFLDLRFRSAGKKCFREVGDFVAHREERTRGFVTNTARHIFTSVNVWSMNLRNITPTKDDILEAAKANIFLATDEQLQTMVKLRRGSAEVKLKRIEKKIKRGHLLIEKEAIFFEQLANQFVWRPAFNGDSLFEEFCAILSETKIVSMEELTLLRPAKKFITLFALVSMHGCKLNISENINAEVLVGYKNNENYLCAFITIKFEELRIPINIPIALFMTDLNPEKVCSPPLQSKTNDNLITWENIIEIGDDGLLHSRQV